MTEVVIAHETLILIIAAGEAWLLAAMATFMVVMLAS